MKVEEKGHTITIRDTQGNLDSFIEKVKNEHGTFKNHNLILDISHHKDLTNDSIRRFEEVSNKHGKGKKSFVVVADGIDFNAVPNRLTVVPSLQEAHDIIEMEEIERDLGF
ncbi:ribonuclease Z [Flavobacterium aciduliphilum]|uniref:Uncharacterized protein n=1 Tax=Flavobacterium aciduliphilum TaxID=1101402 RepID=A0A328YIK4_9FLAO|nr:ribonuclease Z [Flavobacterium aciduliphilum]RAR73881.1 hypothetical protein CLV55_103201 [Flavobacterium aciduliphilum]